MTTRNQNPYDRSTDEMSQSWRYKAGVSLFVLGNIILISAILLPLSGLTPKNNAGLIGTMVVGGEIVSLTSIVFLGKAGFLALKNKLFGAIRAGYAAPVGPLRHYIGIALFCTNVVTTYFIMYYAWQAFAATTPGAPAPEVWGLDLDQQGALVLWAFLAGEISFLISIYVLGADWWERFRRIFVWSAADAAS